ncbi:hypothetical protein [Metabacillus malikii]|uniref:Purine-cytosine permease-like protein n=1 Tax=Metabacillus malikii TaxID=1504265 RepID=A0ABT9ZCC0_9BACI|nr:hypothetical protein [Metabacillus malikii]MDQ0229902.1 purine-cytosine permease-like protein [Metabacillus malikii]
MGQQQSGDFILRTFLNVIGDFLILFVVVLLCEWYANKKGYNVVERAWLVTVVVLMVLMLALWKTYGRLLHLL